MNAVMVEIGARIADARKRVGLTQGAVAGRLGVAQGTVSRWESGDRELNVSDLLPLAAALGMSPALLLDPDCGGGYFEGYRAGWDDCVCAVEAAVRRMKPGQGGGAA